MDEDVVAGSVTDWTVTIDDQCRLKWAMVRLRLRSWAYWGHGLVLPTLIAGTFWFGMHDLDPRSEFIGHTVRLGMTITVGTAFLALMLTLPLTKLLSLVSREYPVGATLTAWATEAGLGVRTLRRLTFYPWSRLTLTEAGPVLVRCRQDGPKTLAVPAYLPTGPDEVARSIDFPARLIGPETRRELARGAGREPVGTPTAGEPAVVDRSLRWRLIRAWLWAQFGILTWLYPAMFSVNIALWLASGSYRMAIFMTVLTALSPLAWLLNGEGRMSGMYPVGTAVNGSVGEWLETQGPWGSVAWHHAWLKQRRMTKHTVTYEMVHVRPDGTPTEPANVDKRIIVIPRAFLDAPVRVSSPGS